MTNADLLAAEARALERAKKQRVQVFPINPHTWIAPSVSRPGRAYLLEVTRHNVRCTCPAARYRRVCKHAALVRDIRRQMLAL